MLKHHYPWDIFEPMGKKLDAESERVDRFADANRYFENNAKNTSRAIVLQKLMASFEEGKISIWFGNYSNQHSLLKSYLKDFLITDKEVLSILKRNILNSGFEKWVIVSQLLWFLENKLEKNQAEILHSVVNEHFSILIRPEEICLQRYVWLMSSTDDFSADQKLIELIIWLLNHPSSSIRDQANDTLLWLARIGFDNVVVSLINESISDKPINSCVECSYILKRMSTTNPELLKDILLSIETLKTKIIQVTHFTIFKNYFDMSVQMNKIGYTDLYKKLKVKIPKARILSGEVILDEDYLIPLQDEIEFLNEMQVLNKDSCDILKRKVSEYCSPLNPIDFETSDKYVKRSFYKEEYYDGRLLLNEKLITIFINCLFNNNSKMVSATD
jgi:hypothetical protein